MTQSPTDIAADLERLAEKATPGSWVAAGEGVQVTERSGDYSPYVASYVADDDANLIVAYRNHHAAICSWPKEIARLEGEAGELRKALEEAALQIEYLHGKFQFTGSGNNVLAKIRRALGSAKE